VNGQEYLQSLEVRKDPNSRGTMEEVRQNAALVSELQDDLDRAVDVIHGAELIRSQLQAFRRVHDGDDAVELRSAAEQLEQQFTEVEAQLLQLYSTGRGQDVIRWPMRVAQQIGSLAGSVESSDFAPTRQQIEVHDELHAELEQTEAAFDALMREDLAAFNARIRDRGIAGIHVPE